MVQHLWGTVLEAPRKMKELPNDPGVLPLGIYTQENWKHIHSKTGAWYFIAVFFIFPKWKQCRCPFIDEWMNKMCVTVEYYSTIWKDEVLIHTLTRMNLENIMLSERRLSQKKTIIWFHACKMSKTDKFMTENRFHGR